MADLMFKISAHSASPAKTIVKARNFQIIVDEPASLGGSNEGPNPVEYVLASLAGCLNVMGHVVAGEMGFELRGVKIDISGDLNPDRLFGKSFDERAGYKNIEVKMTPDCDTDKDTLEKWIETVDERCPVSDNLSNATPIQFKLA
ncbi:MAG TPA: OsmC family protein [Bacteroidales bacterium]|jgi:uncharacterized OsmC-like protein|nr:OsmC family protein [Bacteroidales bacterium]HOS72523.1 OsmC family protein [Bacteroidales bacterium]HQH24359.1 OsmC family protein [Bacteroidales bacterium]HQK70663.1 OsmC family protein [Bacteroidales bacterium]